MSLPAPEKTRGTHRRSGRRTERVEAPQFGFTPPQPPLKTRVKRQERRRRRFLRRALAAYLVLLTAVAGALWFVRYRQQPAPKASAPPVTRVGSLLAWSVQAGDRTFVAVIALPPTKPPVALAVPPETVIDVPGGGPPTVGSAEQSPGTLVASMEAVFDRQVQHYLVSTSADFTNLIDRIGGVRVLVEEAFLWDGLSYGPGETRLSGGAAAEYLATSAPEDATARWEDVLSGVLAATSNTSLLAAPVGTTDDPSLVPSLLSRAHGAAVIELPTAPADGGGLQVDAKALRELTLRRFPGIGGKLTRVVVLNGNGKPGLGWQIAQALASKGFRVVASQNLPTFNYGETQVIAASPEFLGLADDVRSLLGLGKVYVGPQPTGIADITIVVGKDYAQA